LKRTVFLLLAAVLLTPGCDTTEEPTTMEAELTAAVLAWTNHDGPWWDVHVAFDPNFPSAPPVSQPKTGMHRITDTVEVVFVVERIDTYVAWGCSWIVDGEPNQTYRSGGVAELRLR
jgi:hypothetical protein